MPDQEERTVSSSPSNESDSERQRLASVLTEIKAQLARGAEEVAKSKATVTETRNHITNEYYSVPKSFDELVDLAGGMGMLKLAGKMHRFTLARLNQLERLARSAYFGRIDFHEGGRTRPIYIGISSLTSGAGDEHLVFDWRAPVSSVYYDYELGQARYESPGGIVEGEVLLKRHFKICDGEILLMYDNNLTIFDEILQETLGKATGDRMKSIVNTIQREQNLVIRDDSRSVLLVQGCAGSGKTSIALHRAAYLLYKHRKDLSADSILMVTPNRIFEDYTSPVLPELGEEPLRQAAFADLARDLLRLPDADAAPGETTPPGPTRVEEFADQLEYVLELRNRASSVCGKPETATRASSARLAGIGLKSSREFARALRLYAGKISEGDYGFGDLSHRGKVLVSGSEVASLIHKEYAYLPVAKRIEKAKRRMMWIMDEVQSGRVSELETEIAADPDSAHLFKRDIKEKAAQKGYDEFRPLREKVVAWAPLDYYREYRRLFAEEGLLGELLAGAPRDTDRVDAMCADTVCADTVQRLDSGTIPFEDLAPILYLKGILEGLREDPQVRHVIIDEAQDYDALQFQVLRAAFPRASFTVLGDLNQAIGPAGGTLGNEGYEAAATGLDAGQGTRFVRLEKSYRSTREITEFTRAILDGGQPVEAIERPGERPVAIRSRDSQTLAAAVAHDIRQLKAEGYESIAVICRTARESWTAFERLHPLLETMSKPKEASRTNGQEDTGPISRQGETGLLRLVTKEQRRFVRGVLVIPSYLAKGLEFEAVIIYDAGSKTYSHPDDRRVLYTACTRALHRLHIHHTGDLSPLLAGAEQFLLVKG